MARFLLPLALFLGIVGLLAWGLQHDPKRVPSVLIDKPAPSFSLPSLHQPELLINSQQLRGQVRLLNVWASWCVECRAEHAVLNRLARMGQVEIIGLNYKDQRNAALAWLNELGNPYTASAFDEQGRVGIDWGVYGVPETFVIDSYGVIRDKIIGPLDDNLVREQLLPLLQRLRSE